MAEAIEGKGAKVEKGSDPREGTGAIKTTTDRDGAIATRINRAGTTAARIDSGGATAKIDRGGATAKIDRGGATTRTDSDGAIATRADHDRTSESTYHSGSDHVPWSIAQPSKCTSAKTAP